MVNLGVPLEDVGMILNSKAAKLWAKNNRFNKSLFHDTKGRRDVVNAIYEELGVDNRPDPNNISIDPSKMHLDDVGAQAQVVALFEMLSDMNEQVQAVSVVMGGHNKMHVNPLVLQEQLERYQKVVSNRSDRPALEFNESMKSNPDLQNYLRVMRATLEHTQTLNPVYRDTINKMFMGLKNKIRQDLTDKQIEEYSEDILKFVSSRLLGHNNADQAYLKAMMSPTGPQSIYTKLQKHIDKLKNTIQLPDNYEELGMALQDFETDLEKSVLFTKALSLNLNTSDPGGMGIWANSQFVNESFNKEDRLRAQEEFETLPLELQRDLIFYDLVRHGWKGKSSIVPFFDKETISDINIASDLDLESKNATDISKDVLRQLEHTIALRSAMKSGNPFEKVYLGSRNNFKGEASVRVLTNIAGQESVMGRIGKNPAVGMYVNTTGGGKRRLFEISPLSIQQISDFKNARGREGKRITLINAIVANMKEVPNNLIGKGNINLATIGDSSTGIDPMKRTSFNRETQDAPNTVEHTLTPLSSETFSQDSSEPVGMDARVDWDSDEFWQEQPLSEGQYSSAMEYNEHLGEASRKGMYQNYLKKKAKANEIAKTLEVEGKSTEELLAMYEQYGVEDAYAYSIVMTPIVKQLAQNLIAEQASLFEKNGVVGRPEGGDVTALNAMFLSGSTIPSNHPAAQAMARTLEREYKNFIEEKKRYIREMNAITQDLYNEKLSYGDNKVIRFFKKLRDGVFRRGEVYQKLYGNLVVRQEVKDEKGKITYDFRLRPKKDIEQDFKDGIISPAEKNFYDYFVKTTGELKQFMPQGTKQMPDYIPHTAMSTAEAFGARGLFGLMANSRGENEALADVKMYHRDHEGNRVLMTFRNVEDQFKSEASSQHKKNDINKILEYKRAKRKALKLLKSGKNEDGSRIMMSNVAVETALGFGAINRFAENRSVKATELPSMDLNKALGDYIHSTLFVNGNEKFKGMRKLQGLVDGVLAYNREKGNTNMNKHVQEVWKDYFIRNQRQETIKGNTISGKVDKVVRTLTNLNLFYALGYQANKNTMGLYAVGNILAGKYHNIKDLGGRAWLKGEARYWGLDRGLEGGFQGVIDRHKRAQRMLKNMNFMDINIYDEVNIEKKEGLDKQLGDLALAPMLLSENWIQRVHMLGMLSDEELDAFDDHGNFKPGRAFDTDRLIELEDRVKASHGRGYQPTDQRAIQMYSWGNMMMQFAKFIPTMVHDRFSQRDVNIYGREHIGSLRAVGHTLRALINNPDGKGMMEYYNDLSPAEQERVKSGLRGMAMSTLIGFGALAGSKMADDLYWDTNYYFNHEALEYKMIPSAIRNTENMVGSIF